MIKLALASLFLIMAIGMIPSHAQYNPFEHSSEYKGYTYKYIDANFKTNLKNATEKNKLAGLEKEVLASLGATKDPLLRSEKLVQLGILSVKQKFYHAASFFFMEAAAKNVGNSVGEFALSELSKLLQNFYTLDDSYLVDFFNENFFDGMHPDVQSMASYYRARYFARKDFSSWAKNASSSIHDKSPWFYRVKLGALMHSILDGGGEFPFEQVRKFYSENESKMGSVDRDELYLVSARFLFEQGEFEKAFSVYQNIKPYTARLKGQIVLEMAWSKYYSQDYAHSLGLLNLLKAPYFEISDTTERFILEILIYRQLCHYNVIMEVEKQYNKKYKNTYKAIARRRKQSSNLSLVNMSFMDEALAKKAQSLIDLKSAVDRWEDNEELIPTIFEKMELRLVSLENQLEDNVKASLPKIMNHMLISKQEIGYLSYIAKLDTMRSEKANKQYSSEKVEKYKYEKLFWKTNGEFWLDELDDYRVLINSKCGGDES